MKEAFLGASSEPENLTDFVRLENGKAIQPWGKFSLATPSLAAILFQ